jgi:putative hydrolase of the HAD superfamily
MTRVRAVICDFGGVLTTPLFHAFAAYQDEVGVPFEEMVRAIQEIAEETGRHPLYELEKGHISEAEFVRSIEQRLDVHLRGMRETYFDHIHPNEPMIELMRRLRNSGLRMALLTNNVREWEPHWRAKLPDVDEIFEVIVDSAFVGMRKPEPEIYELTLARLRGDPSALRGDASGSPLGRTPRPDGGLAPGECLFVDDVDVNCDTARGLGMRAVHFVDNEQAIAEVEAALRP